MSVSFELVPLYNIPLLAGAVRLLYVLAYNPTETPLPSVFGQLAEVAKTRPQLFPNILRGLVGVHALEAAYVLRVALKHGVAAKDALLWTLQTFIFGLPSTLLFLKRVRAAKRKGY